jgi:hypothetical protein
MGTYTDHEQRMMVQQSGALLDRLAAQPADGNEIECKACGGEGWMPWCESYTTRDGFVVNDSKCECCNGLGVITR